MRLKCIFPLAPLWSWSAVLIGVVTTKIAPCAHFCKLNPLHIVD